MKMFFIRGDITIKSGLGFKNTASLVSNILKIPQFIEDLSGRWEEHHVLVSECFGLEFVFGRIPQGKSDEYGLSISSTILDFYDGTERDVDATKYIILLLSQAKEIEVYP